MRKLLAALSVCLILASCGGSGSKPSADAAKNLETAKRLEGKALLTKNDCLTCHIEQEKLVGPAYKDVAAKYAGQEGAVNMLVDKVINGGSGVWGDVAMAAHPNLSRSDAEKMVNYILTVK